MVFIRPPGLVKLPFSLSSQKSIPRETTPVRERSRNPVEPRSPYEESEKISALITPTLAQSPTSTIEAPLRRWSHSDWRVLVYAPLYDILVRKLYSLSESVAILYDNTV